MPKVKASQSNCLGLDRICAESEHPIQMAYRLHYEGYISSADLRTMIDDITLEYMEGYSKTYMKTCLAGEYGREKVQNWNDMRVIENIFIDEFNIEQGRLLKERMESAHAQN